MHQCVELYVKENVEENEYDLYEVYQEDAARASIPRQSAWRGARAVSIESFYDDEVVEDTDDQDKVERPTNNARTGKTKSIVEAYYVDGV